MSKTPILQAVSLSKQYGKGVTAVDVLREVQLEIAAGDRVAIIGASGSGKSTLLHLLGGLDKPAKGEVRLNGQAFSSMSEARRSAVRNQSLGFVYQFHHLLPELTALENVALPLLIRRQPAAEARKQALALLEQVGLATRAAHKPGELSGGERQRTAIARALVTRPACLLADEPTGNLDSDNARQAFDCMLELNQQLGTALVLVTHDLELAGRMQQRYRLRDGRLNAES
ncbi:lipoprotein-releasing ABC transporter ATP-binding protein LolD [Leeia sp.]|uniref:lipoprotein-releasing ABC transporter ATP-binding protein LolD n=1 Tax=Leeia sp. TaxID=2884678 RepID=UPI0035B201FC